jgi:hypothetical protein
VNRLKSRHTLSCIGTSFKQSTHFHRHRLKARYKFESTGTGLQEGTRLKAPGTYPFLFNSSKTQKGFLLKGTEATNINLEQHEPFL